MISPICGRLRAARAVAPLAAAPLAVALAAVLPLSVASSAMAAEAGPALPQLNFALWPTQIFWMAVTFTVLYLVLSRVALPRIESTLEERDNIVAADLAKAEELRAESESILASYERALNDARVEARQVTNDALAAAEADMAARMAAQDADLAAKLDAAMARIEQARRTAMADVRAMAAELARDVTGKLAGVEVSEAASAAAVARAAGSDA